MKQSRYIFNSIFIVFSIISSTNILQPFEQEFPKKLDTIAREIFDLRKEMFNLKNQNINLKEGLVDLKDKVISNQKPSNIENHLHADQKVLQSSQQTQNTFVDIKNEFFLMLDAGKQHAKESCLSLQNTLANNKLKLVLATTTCCYLTLCYYIYKAEQVIKNKQSWCNWKQLIELQDLVSNPYNEIIPILLQDIQRKSFLLDTTEQNNASTLFLATVQKELMQLKRYVKIKEVLSTCYYSKLFAFSYELDEIKGKINRLNWLLDTFAKWQTNALLKEKIDSEKS